MVSTIAPSFNSPISACGPRQGQEPPAPQPPAPQPPPDQVDFSVIDTAAKAAACPAMDPAVQLGLGAGIAAVIMAGMGGGSIPLITLDVQTKTAGQEGNLSFGLDMQNEQSPVTVSGDFAGQAVNGGLVVNEETQEISWNGTIGGNEEKISFLGMNQESMTAQVGVQFGSVNGNLELSPVMDEAGETPLGYHVTGDLGGEAYDVTTTWKLPEGFGKEGQEPPQKLEATISSVGTLGGQEIRKEYKVEAQMTGGGLMVNVNGGGNVAGIAQEVNGTLAIVP
jgi:hypothetical protein